MRESAKTMDFPTSDCLNLSSDIKIYKYEQNITLVDICFNAGTSSKAGKVLDTPNF